MHKARPWTMFGAALLMCAPAPVAAQAQAGQPTVQQQFDAASAALQRRAWDEALRIFEALEARLLALGNARSLALVRIRKGEALVGLRREVEAQRAIRLGLPVLAAGDETLREDRFLAYVTLGEIAERALDYGEAFNNYQAAEPLARTTTARSRAIRGLIQTGMFFDARAALDRANAAIAAAQAETPANRRLEASMRTLKGRVLLNLSAYTAARVELKRAVELLGGLSRKVDAADLAARSDLAIAALLDGDKADARKYLAWTGAGRGSAAFPRGSEMRPPPCGDQLRPEDVAVVEFSIFDDGSIGHATPIYSSRQGAAALAFARAVAGWSWTADRVAKVPTLFRMLTRVELRCSTAVERTWVGDRLREDLDKWFKSRGLPVSAAATRTDASRLKPLQDELGRRQAATGEADVSLLPILADIAVNAAVGDEEREKAVSQGLAIAKAGGAPPSALGWFGMRQAMANTKWGPSYYRRYAGALRSLSRSPEIAADPRARTAVAIELADALFRASDEGEAIGVLRQAAAAPGLAADDPLRASVYAKLASVLVTADRPEEARAAFAASGLRPDQCELQDAASRLKRGGVTSNDFPTEALNWGFEGWATIEFDIDAVGNTANIRPTVAFPPFVFGQAASAIIERYRFDPGFRPEGGGCGGQYTTIHFRIWR
jgi:tetratricopeptide (TPR) repeat protein